MLYYIEAEITLAHNPFVSLGRYIPGAWQVLGEQCLLHGFHGHLFVNNFTTRNLITRRPSSPDLSLSLRLFLVHPRRVRSVHGLYS